MFGMLAFFSTGLTGFANARGDIYIRAQYSNGGPAGLHEILTVPEDGYYKAQFCGRTYWVLIKTVIWIEEQSAAGRILVLEENTGGSSKVLCVGAAAFARLEDLGLDPEILKKLRRKPQRSNRRLRRLPLAQD
ncbi:hypothetical protein [Roseibium sp. SCP14]|uniref:hypothetical protein n=1 Tax=Roseibium sp. SCP14 TaxID=3141375 RepID=UPI0033375847